MHIFWKLFLLIGLQLISSLAVAQQIALTSVDYWNQSKNTRVAFNTSSPVIRKVFFLDNPSRLVIDFKNTYLITSLAQPPSNHPYFKKIRSGQRNTNDLRVVIDLKKNNLNIAQDKETGHRFVLDLVNANQQIIKQNVTETPKPFFTAPKKTEPKVISKSAFKKGREIIIAIDAGHGGIDSGARGSKGTKEKKVVFAIAQKLAKLINQRAGMRAVMVRKGDYYIKLRRRMEIAREAKADLFISIHADAFKNSKVRGASVFTLSRSGASSEAAHWLANHENAADLVGGVSLDDKDDTLASVLLDLSQNATKEASRNVASKVLKHFKSIGKLHQHSVQKAGFAVLKSPDIPSILIETAFISNPYEEQNLRSRAHQGKIANAVFKGVVSYFKEYAPADTRMAYMR